MPKSAKWFIIGAVIALFTSSIGPYGLAIISATGGKDLIWYDLSVYFYLHFHYNGWLTLMLIGLFIVILAKRKIDMNESLLHCAFWTYFISIFPGYLLSALWADLGLAVQVIATVGIIGQWVGVVLILLAFKDAFKQARMEFSRLTWWMLLLTFTLLFTKSTMELGMIYPGLAELVNTTRSVIIGYLHLTLLGFISIFILVQYQMQGITKVNRYYTYSFTIFFSGFLLNELLLFLNALGQWTNLFSIPYFNEGLLLAAILLGIGVAMLTFTVSPYDQSKAADRYIG